MMPALLTCREDNMSKLAIYSSDDDSDLGDDDTAAEKDELRNGGETGLREDQPSTGRTEAVSEFSNLAGMSAATTSVFPLKKAAALAGDAALGGRTLGLVPSYSTTGYAGWSKFCLATSDGEHEEDGSDTDSFKQNKEVRRCLFVKIIIQGWVCWW